MSEIDVEKLKAAITTLKQQRPGQGKVEPVQEAEDAPAGKNRQQQIGRSRSESGRPRNVVPRSPQAQPRTRRGFSSNSEVNAKRWPVC
jgi:hypothetical protein